MLQLRVRVDLAAAIRAGHAQAGVSNVAVDDADVEKMPPAVREELIQLVEDGRVLGDDEADGPICAATVQEVVRVLGKRADARAAAVEAKASSETMTTTEAARASEEAAVRLREQKAKEAVRQDAIRVWVEEHGDDSQLARMSEGLLPEEEVLEAVVNEVFEPLSDHTVYDPIRLDQVCECLCAPKVRFETGKPSNIDSRQHRELQAIREDAPEGAKVTAVLHKGVCPGCACTPLARLGAKVEIEWKGWILAREYSLG